MPVQKTTKDQIIIKSIEVFLKQGYYKTSMSDLAEACGLQKGSFYYHFKSKEELYSWATWPQSKNKAFKLWYSIKRETTYKIFIWCFRKTI